MTGPEPLLAVKVLLQSKGSFSDLPHVVTSVSTFLDSSVELPLHRACKFGSIKLLERIWSTSQVYTTYTAVSYSSNTGTSWSLGRFLRSDRHYRQYQLNLSLTEAAGLKDVPMARWLLNRLQGCAIRSEVVVKAVAVGCLEMLKLFLEEDSTRFLGDRAQAKVMESGEGHYVVWGLGLMETAISRGHSSIAWWLKANLLDVDHDLDAALETAVGCGDIATATWLESIGATWRFDGFASAQQLSLSKRILQQFNGARSLTQQLAASGRLDVLQWLRDHGKLRGTVGALITAAEAGQLDIVRWLINSNAKDMDRGRLVDLGGVISLSIHAAAVNGHLDAAKYLRSAAIKTTSTFERDEENADLGCKKREMNSLIGRGVALKVSWGTMTIAAHHGFMDVVQWLFAEYCDDPDVDIFNLRRETAYPYMYPMDAAASNGHLDVLKYLHELSTTLEVNTRKRKRGDELVTEDKPICTAEAMAGAASGGHLATVQWLHDTRKLNCSSTAMEAAAGDGHLEVLQWLHQHSSEKCSTRTMDHAAAFGHLEVVKWLHQNTDAGCTTYAMDAAANAGYLDVVKWLHENRSEGCTASAMTGAAISGHMDVVKWLHKHRTEGCNMHAMTEFACKRQLNMIQWLCKHRPEECTVEATKFAVLTNDFETLLYLHYQVGMECTKDAALWALDSKIPEIYEWIVEQYPNY